LGSKLIKPLETYNAYLNISVSIILPLFIVVKAYLITVWPTCYRYRQRYNN